MDTSRKIRKNPYQALIDAYEKELEAIDISVCPNVVSQIKMEIRKLREGIIDSLDIISDKKVKIRAKIDFPVEQFPGINFSGKIIGPAGKTLKDLQEKTDTRMSVLGAGSMRNQNKELELIQTGEPKYQHLNERLHLQIDCLASPSEAYSRLSKAIEEIKVILTPDPSELPQQPTQLSWHDISSHTNNFNVYKNNEQELLSFQPNQGIYFGNNSGSRNDFGFHYEERRLGNMKGNLKHRSFNPYNRPGPF